MITNKEASNYYDELGMILRVINTNSNINNNILNDDVIMSFDEILANVKNAYLTFFGNDYVGYRKSRKHIKSKTFFKKDLEKLIFKLRTNDLLNKNNLPTFTDIYLLKSYIDNFKSLR